MLTAVPIVEENQVKTLRVIRNACRATLRDMREITEIEQLAWWSSLPKSHWKGWLFADRDGVCGAGHWTLLDDGWYVTVMVIPERQGRGIGTAIYRVMSEMRPADIGYALIDEENAASKMAATSAGWLPLTAPLWRTPA